MRILGAVLAGLALALPGSADEGAAGVTALVDSHVGKGWERLGIAPAKEAADEEFLRRATLDLAGVIPSAGEVERFLKDSDPRKRDRKVDELLASRDHARHWAQLWTVVLAGWFQEEFEGYDRGELRDWLEEQFAGNVPWNRIVQSLLSATGNTVANRAANFGVRYLSEGPEAFTTRVAKSFLGIRLSCAQCHDHPFDVWRQEDFFAMASFVSRTQVSGVSRKGRPIYELVDAVAGDPITPQGFPAPVAPRFLNGTEPATNLWRQELALFVTRSPQFARAFVNRAWTQLLGRGIVHPPENFSRKNSPSHPELLEALAKDFAAGGYDVRRLLRGLANSRPYRLSSENAAFKPEHRKFFPHAVAKPLTPWQLFNSVARACGLEKDYAGEPERFGADREAFILEFYDSLDGDATSSHEYTESSQNLLTKFSRDYLADAGTSEKHALLSKLAPLPADRRVELVYLAVLGRRPQEDERSKSLKYLESVKSEDETQGIRDLFYALVNSHEFNTNH